MSSVPDLTVEVSPVTVEAIAGALLNRLETSPDSGEVLGAYTDGSGDSLIIMAAPPPDPDLATVSANDLNTYLGSGAVDYIAYRVDNNTSVCLYPVRIDDNGYVQGDDCTEITIDTSNGGRVVTYGTDSISLQMGSNGYYYSDIMAPYITLHPLTVHRSPLDIVLAVTVICYCLLSLMRGVLFRRD